MSCYGKIKPHHVRAGARFNIHGVVHRVTKGGRRALDGAMYELCVWDRLEEEWTPASRWASTEAVARYLNENDAEPMRKP